MNELWKNRSEYSLFQAAYLWAGYEPPAVDASLIISTVVEQNFESLIKAIIGKTLSLKYPADQFHIVAFIPQSALWNIQAVHIDRGFENRAKLLDRIMISPSDLKKYFISIHQKPEFLFPIESNETTKKHPLHGRATRWEDVKITLISYDTVRIETLGSSERFSFCLAA